MFLFPSPPRIDLIFLYPRNHQNRAYFFVINSIRPVSQIYVQVDTYFIMPLLSCLLCGRGGFKTGHGLLMHQKTNQNCVALQHASQFLDVSTSVLHRPPDNDAENDTLFWAVGYGFCCQRPLLSIQPVAKWPLDAFKYQNVGNRGWHQTKLRQYADCV